MSRRGRDYLKVGYYTEIYFVEKDVRYIAISDGVDSSKRTQKVDIIFNFIGEIDVPDNPQDLETKGNGIAPMDYAVS